MGNRWLYMPQDFFGELIYDLIIKCILKPHPDKPYFGQFDKVPTPNLKEYNILLGKLHTRTGTVIALKNSVNTFAVEKDSKVRYTNDKII